MNWGKLNFTPFEWVIIGLVGLVVFRGLHNQVVRSYAVTDSRTFNAVGDIDKGDSGRTISNILSDKPNLIVLLGDFGYSTSASSWAKGVAKPLIDSGIPLVGALGNHDSSSNYLKYIFSKYGQKNWTARKTIGNVRFIGLNSESPNFTTMQGMLNEAEADPNLRWIIPFMHKAVFTPVGSHHPAEVPEKFHHLFKKYTKVKLVLQGHNHNYIRMHPWDGITYVQVGTGGREPYPDASDAKTAVNISPVFGVLHCSTSADSISCRFIDNKGAVRDAFSVM